ncbi:recombinase family protein [Planococcus shenhongbingii]|uniref:recombinase family protein n=1 Tax=Planococcus shenhongbingii TaxID=3058398 RepID=UPI002616C37D|nr:recombinase family protein [Planococcus sp. N016]WKA57643.1 recombinase family protein [Planococcus sp. N016]
MIIKESGNNLIKIKYVALYLRKSRGDDTSLVDDVLKRHRIQLINFANLLGFSYDIFQEIGSSETIRFRPEFIRLLERVKLGIYDAVIAIDFDRITRGNSEIYEEIKEIFMKTKTPILTPYGEIIDFSKEIDANTDMKAILNQYEYMKTKKRLHDGKIRSAHSGFWVNGTPPIGFNYDKNTKKLIIDEKYKELVQKIFDLYVNKDLPLYEIAFELNRQGFKGKRGGFFREIQIRRILLNEAYIGNIVFGKSEGSGHLRKNTKPLKRMKEADWIRIENAHPAIVELNLFKLAKIKMAERQKIPFKLQSEINTLSGIIRCGQCNSIMKFTQKQHVKKESKTLYIKKCQHPDPYGDRCHNKGCNSEVVLRALQQQIEEYQMKLLKTNNATDLIAQRKLEINIETTEEKIEGLKQSMVRIKGLFVDGFIDQKEMLDRIEFQKKKLNENCREVQALKIELMLLPKQTFNRKKELVHEVVLNFDVNNPFNPTLNKLLQELIDCIYYTKTEKDISIKVDFS